MANVLVCQPCKPNLIDFAIRMCNRYFFIVLSHCLLFIKQYCVVFIYSESRYLYLVFSAVLENSVVSENSEKCTT